MGREFVLALGADRLIRWTHTGYEGLAEEAWMAVKRSLSDADEDALLFRSVLASGEGNREGEEILNLSVPTFSATFRLVAEDWEDVVAGVYRYAFKVRFADGTVVSPVRGSGVVRVVPAGVEAG